MRLCDCIGWTAAVVQPNACQRPRGKRPCRLPGTGWGSATALGRYSSGTCAPDQERLAIARGERGGGLGDADLRPRHLGRVPLDEVVDHLPAQCGCACEQQVYSASTHSLRATLRSARRAPLLSEGIRGYPPCAAYLPPERATRPGERARACVRARWHGRACSRVSLETGGSTPKPSHVSRITLVGCVSVSAGIFAFLRACVVLPPQTAWRES